ncbi:MAG TPA: hypothetical protein DEB06_00755 [Phycisphaerales bacterium]|nr:hypothetical protein [Phycisphaerales bacterium]
MTSRAERIDRASRVVGGVLVAMLSLAGCGDSTPTGQNAASSAPGGSAPRTPAPPPAPAASLAGVKLHSKVQFPEERLPSSQEATNAIAAFASALAGGDHAGFGAMLGERDRAVLAALVSDGEWRRLTDAIRVVRVCVVAEPSAGMVQVGLGLEDEFGAFLSGWEGTGAGGQWSFSAMGIETVLGANAKALDGSAMNARKPPEVVAPPPPPAPAAQPEPEEPAAPIGGGDGPLGRPPNF